MTEIAIVASGSRGDVQPYIALGRGLQAAGYRVRLLATDNFAPLATEAGLTFVGTGLSPEERVQTDAWREVLESGNFLRILAKMRQEMSAAADDLGRQMPPLLKGSDLILTGLAGLSGIFALGEAWQIPVIQAYVFPFTPTAAFATPLVPRLPLGRLLNRPSFHLTRQMFWQMSRTVDGATRRAAGLPAPGWWGPYRALDRQAVPVLYGYSAHVLPRPQDWPARYQVTGYWFLDEPADWQPPPALVDFLNAGEPPVYIGFGSMGSRNPQAAGQIALAALARSGQRGVLAAGWGGLKVTDVPATVQVIGALPHSWLFPRMGAVVHHGGAGTTAAAMRAGVPAVMVPFMGDQPFWGRRAADLGVGTQPIPRRQLTADNLARAITAAVTDRDLRRRAADLGERLREEDGVNRAVAVIRQFMPPQPAPKPAAPVLQRG
ncbi:MAG: glycosyltransferase [Anaerolineae bacterium]|nr:glycosyltransferase [Anaerolineae bacterium]